MVTTLRHAISTSSALNSLLFVGLQAYFLKWCQQDSSCRCSPVVRYLKQYFQLHRLRYLRPHQYNIDKYAVLHSG
ncbi:hypothetical protein PR003_g2081 [Phytophthora rubi]|uniref:Secreted protein n=1 Tax=Phytophthora rubi TaxID=129364 RepID=A0A6A3NY43_9STRA|nr:hypothetical protein PR002_g4056 [Phytophthora rubi]KAE9047985.1 hypothetical protein PR001_g4002 [Phytophthora rubi]KAE9356876.1 hypothetical protein PR003_g2081 [Phytophthora rubi]